MGRILAVDYGKRRVGIAVTDPLKIIASPLTTVSSGEALGFIKKYCEEEEVETIVIGMPYRANGEETHNTKPSLLFGKKLKKVLPELNITFEDERYTSKMAMEAMIEGGMKKKDRRKKENIDKISAAIILQSFIETK